MAVQVYCAIKSRLHHCCCVHTCASVSHGRWALHSRCHRFGPQRSLRHLLAYTSPVWCSRVVQGAQEGASLQKESSSSGWICRLCTLVLLGSDTQPVCVGAIIDTPTGFRLPGLCYRLLAHPDPGVRARACNLLGNMCRHSAYFYSALDRHGLVQPLIQRCTDTDKSTRKFACFAIGNAGE